MGTGAATAPPIVLHHAAAWVARCPGQDGTVQPIPVRCQPHWHGTGSDLTRWRGSARVHGRRGWLEVVVKALKQGAPIWIMTAKDAADLGRCRCDVEPLRIAIMP